MFLKHSSQELFLSALKTQAQICGVLNFLPVSLDALSPHALNHEDSYV